MTDCLNCGAPLHGPFCAACGQRAVPPNPTVRELAGDAWQELSGYDGRIMATVRGLIRPGYLTREYLAGRRAHYLPPVRVYLIVSVIYFVVAAAAPQLDGSDGPGGIRISIDNPDNGNRLTDEERAKMLAELDEQPWFMRPLMRAMAADPDGLRQRMFTVMPRVFFAMLPLFAAIVAMFYRRRPFPTALVFAVHIHAFAFVVLTITEAAKFTRSIGFAEAVGSVIALVLAIYVLRALRAMFGGGWVVTIVKAVAIGFVYIVLSIPAFIIMVMWASLT